MIQYNVYNYQNSVTLCCALLMFCNFEFKLSDIGIKINDSEKSFACGCGSQ